MNLKGRDLRFSTTSESQLHSEKSIGRFHLNFYAKLPTSSLAGVSGSFAFFFPIFLAVPRQFSSQVNSLLLSKKKFQILLQKHRHFPTKTAVAIVIGHRRAQSPSRNHGKEARSKPCAIKIKTDSSKWFTSREVSEILEVESRSIMRCILSFCCFYPQVTF